MAHHASWLVLLAAVLLLAFPTHGQDFRVDQYARMETRPSPRPTMSQDFGQNNPGLMVKPASLGVEPDNEDLVARSSRELVPLPALPIFFIDRLIVASQQQTMLVAQQEPPFDPDALLRAVGMTPDSLGVQDLINLLRNAVANNQGSPLSVNSPVLSAGDFIIGGTVSATLQLDGHFRDWNQLLTTLGNGDANDGVNNVEILVREAYERLIDRFDMEDPGELWMYRGVRRPAFLGELLPRVGINFFSLRFIFNS